MAALPYIQLYVADYLADTAHLSTLEHGAYLLLIFNYWQRGESFKAKDERTLNKRLASVARLTENEFEVVKESLVEFFEITETEWKHRRVEIDLEAVNAKSTKASNAGKASAAQRSNTRSTVVQQTLNHTDTDTDTDTEYKNTSSSADGADVVVDELSKSSQPAKPRLACPVEKLIDVYHTAFPDGSRVKVITAARRAAAKARWLEASRLNVQPFRYANEAEGLAAWRKFFEVCAESDFLTGKVAPQAGRQTWVADFDFFMQPSSFAKCLENKYHREIAA